MGIMQTLKSAIVRTSATPGSGNASGAPIVEPNFSRPATAPEPVDAPTTPSGFDCLRDLPKEELREMGLREWRDGLMLLPHEWFEDIPEGVEVTTISGETKAFDRDTCSDDRRFGYLGYGVYARGEGR